MDFSGRRSSVSIQRAVKNAIMGDDDEIPVFYRGTGKEISADDKHPLLQVAYVKVGDEKEKRDSPILGWYMFLSILILLVIGACTFFFVLASHLGKRSTGDQAVQFINRTVWNATKAEVRALLVGPADMVIVSHIESMSCNINCTEAVQELQLDHMNSPYNYTDIAYNFLIDENGWIYEGRGWGVRPQVAEEFDGQALAVVFIGDFNLSPPTILQVKAFQALLTLGIHQGSLKQSYDLVGLRQLILTNSTGDELYVLLRSWPHWRRCYMKTCIQETMQ